jgi:hypothetical protein
MGPFPGFVFQGRKSIGACDGERVIRGDGARGGAAASGWCMVELVKQGLVMCQGT